MGISELGGVVRREATVQILCPIHCEGENVRTLHQSMSDGGVAFDSLKFVYDVEEDPTLPIIDQIARRDPRVRAERNQFGRGVVHALRWGFARCGPGPVVVVMGDNSDDLTQIADMVDLWARGAKVVAPSRYMKGGRQLGGGALKSTLSRLAGRSLKVMGFPVSDPTSNFKLYDGEWLAAQEIESVGGFEVALELCCKAYEQGLALAEFPTVWRDRTRGESRFRLWKWLPHYLRWYFRILRALWVGVKRRVGPSPEADAAGREKGT